MKNRMVIGIDVGGTNIRMGRVQNEAVEGKILEQPTPDNIFDFKKIAWEMMRELGLEDDTIVGISVPGVVDYKDQKINYCPNLQYLNNTGAKYVLDREFTFVGNDADMALRGELAVNKLWDENVGLVTIGTGVGSSYYVAKTGLWDSNLSSEIGHTKVLLGGFNCSCGSKGCLEAYFSAWSLMRDALEADLEVKDVHEFFGLVRNGNEKAEFILDDASRYLQLSLANFINVSGIDKIIMTGKISLSMDVIYPRIETMMMHNIHMAGKRNIKIITSELIDRGSIIGAADYALGRVDKG